MIISFLHGDFSHDFEHVDEEEDTHFVHFKAGEILDIFDTSDSDWWYGKVRRAHDDNNPLNTG